MPFDEDKRDFIDKLARTERRILDFDRMLECLTTDLYLIKKGFQINYAIDFYEVFRYLNPQWDRTIRISKAKYRLEQSILHYLFEMSEDTLLLLDRFYREFEAKMNNMRRDCQNIYTLYRKHRSQKILSHFGGYTKENETATKEKVPAKFRGFIDNWIACQNIQNSMFDGIDKLKGHFQSGKLYFISQRSDIKKEVKIDESSEEYRRIWSKMFLIRPALEKYENNKTDTIAALSIKKLTEANIKNNQYFVLISSSPAIEPVFLEIEMQLLTPEKVNTPISRNLIYVLLKFYYSKWTYEATLKDIQKVRNQIKEFVIQTAEFKKEILREDDVPRLTKLVRDMDECISVFEKSIITEVDYEDLDIEFEVDIDEKALEVIKNPKRLKAMVRDAYEALVIYNTRLRKLRAIYGFTIF